MEPTSLRSPTSTSASTEPDNQANVLKDQIPPGSEPRDVGQEEVDIIRIPTSDRFYNMVKDDKLRDPGAPKFIPVISSDGTRFELEVTSRFKFKQDEACEWFDRHGRRNAVDGVDMQFNVRDNPDTPWLVWLAENYGVNMTRAGQFKAEEFTREQLITPSADVRLELEEAISERFTELFVEDLGNKEYFCAHTYDSTQPNKCPDILVKVVDIQPVNPEFLTQHEELDLRELDLQTSQKAAELAEQQLASDVRLEKLEQQRLVEELETAKRQAEVDAALCVTLAAAGVDCADYLLAQQGVANPDVRFGQ